MKNLTMVLAIAMMSILLVGLASAQPGTATQTFNLGVAAIYKISIPTSPGDMIITNATAGEDPAPVTDNTTAYSYTTNKANSKITVQGSVALPAGITLSVGLGGNAPVDISNTTAKDAVTSISAGRGTGAIAYTFSATAAAGQLTSTSETVTFTVVQP